MSLTVIAITFWIKDKISSGSKSNEDNNCHWAEDECSYRTPKGCLGSILSSSPIATSILIIRSHCKDNGSNSYWPTAKETDKYGKAKVTGAGHAGCCRLVDNHNWLLSSSVLLTLRVLLALRVRRLVVPSWKNKRKLIINNKIYCLLSNIVSRPIEFPTYICTLVQCIRRLGNHFINVNTYVS